MRAEQGFGTTVVFRGMQRWRWDCSRPHSREPHREKDKRGGLGRRARERQAETERETDRKTDKQTKKPFFRAKTKLERKKTMGQGGDTGAKSDLERQADVAQGREGPQGGLDVETKTETGRPRCRDLGGMPVGRD